MKRVLPALLVVLVLGIQLLTGLGPQALGATRDPAAAPGPLAADRAQGNWPMYAYSPSRIGYNPSETIIDATNVADLVTKWSFLTRARIWHSSAAVVDGTLYVGSMDTHLYALNALSGALRWKFKAGGGVDSSPAVANGVVYFGSRDGKIYAVNASSGVQRWVFSTESGLGEQSPAVVNGTLYMTARDGYLYSINAATGALNWKTPHSYWKINRSPAIGNGMVYFGSDDSHVYAYDAATGAFRWSYRTGGFVKATPSVAYGTVFVGSEDDHLYALDATTGQLRWRKGPFSGSGAILGAPAVWNNTVYVNTAETQPSGSNVYALDAATGATKCARPISDYSASAIAVVNGLVFSVSNGMEVFALDALTCEKLWQSGFGSIAGNILASPAVTGGFMYIGSFDGVLYAFADAIPPRFTFDSSPGEATQSTSASFAFHANETIQGGTTCTLDSDPAVDCSDGTFSASDLSEGSHTLVVTATDASGNTGSSTYPWKVDLTSPVLTILQGPWGQDDDGYINVDRAQFQLQSSEPDGTFQCQFDGGAPEECGEWPTYPDTPDGPHTFTAWAVDLAGNMSQPEARSWIQDTVDPVVWIDDVEGVVHADSYTFTFNSSESVDFSCSRDGGPFSRCSSPYTWDFLTDGSHTLAIYGVDPALNQSVSASEPFVVDGPPRTTLLEVPPNPSFLGTATFVFTSDELLVTYTCTLDNRPPEPCLPGVTYLGLSHGWHDFSVYATDVAGNVGKAKLYTWRILL